MKPIAYSKIFLLVSCLIAEQDSLKTAVTWKHYARAGSAQVRKKTGGFGYYRINRQTKYYFHDIRIFAYGVQTDSFIYLRYKNSNKKRQFPNLYTFTTLSYRKNTQSEISVQYHYNQGAGYFIKNYNSGHLTIELGHAFDMSDYLNNNKKTSYLKSGVYWDHNTPMFSSKLEAEYFYQISDINVTNLTRTQVFLELIFPIKSGVSFNINYEAEDFFNMNFSESTSSANTIVQPNSVSFAIGWKGQLDWTL